MKRHFCRLMICLSCVMGPAYGSDLLNSFTSGSFEIAGEALYWKPSFVGFDYAVAVDGFCVDVFTLKAAYDWGFRAAGRYESGSGCSFWELGGRYISFKDSARVRGEGLIDTFGQVQGGTDVSSCMKIDYWTLDFLWSQYLHRDECMRFWALGGVRYADFSTRFSGASSGGTITANRGGTGRTRADLRGVGPQVGAGGSYTVLGGFELFGYFDAAVLASRRTYRQDTTNLDFEGIISRLRYSRVWGAVPAVDARLGAAFTYRCGCWFVRGQVGYELNYYWNVNKVRVPFTAQPPVTSGTSFQRVDRDIGFGGGFFGLAAGF